MVTFKKSFLIIVITCLIIILLLSLYKIRSVERNDSASIDISTFTTTISNITLQYSGRIQKIPGNLNLFSTSPERGPCAGYPSNNIKPTYYLDGKIEDGNYKGWDKIIGVIYLPIAQEVIPTSCISAIFAYNPLTNQFVAGGSLPTSYEGANTNEINNYFATNIYKTDTSILDDFPSSISLGNHFYFVKESNTAVTQPDFPVPLLKERLNGLNLPFSVYRFKDLAVPNPVDNATIPATIKSYLNTSDNYVLFDKSGLGHIYALYLFDKSVDMNTDPPTYVQNTLQVGDIDSTASLYSTYGSFSVVACEGNRFPSYEVTVDTSNMKNIGSFDGNNIYIDTSKQNLDLENAFYSIIKVGFEPTQISFSQFIEKHPLLYIKSPFGGEYIILAEQDISERCV